MEEKQNEQSKIEKWLYGAVDAMFWVIDETARWWEIGRILVKVKNLRRSQYNLVKRLSASNCSPEESENLQTEIKNLNDLLNSFYAKEEFLRSKCFSYLPHVVFILFAVAFLFGILNIHPVNNYLPHKAEDTAKFGGQISRVRDLPFMGHSVITSAKWFNNNLYVGGDGGLTVIDTTTAIATRTTELPSGFFVRDLEIESDKMFIAGFSGIYVLENTILRNFYPNGELPEKLINSIAVGGGNNFLIGTVGRGLLRGTATKVVYSHGTQKRTVKDFGRQGNELWLMCEDEILTGRGDSFKPLNLQILAGRKLLCMETTEKVVYVGTDQGVVAGYRNARNQVWTILSAGKPGHINDIVVSGDILFVGSDEGVFRFSKGRMDRLSAVPCNSLAVCDTFLAAVNKNSIMLFEFSPAPGEQPSYMAPIPEIGTYTPILPIMPQLPQTRLQYGRLPDFGLLESDNKIPLVQSALASDTPDTEEKTVKPFVQLPAELQKPLFTTIVETDKHYLLATENRGVWAYSDDKWLSVSGVEKPGISALTKNSSKEYAYGDGAGVFEINGLTAHKIIDENETKNILSIYAEADGTLFLLFNNGLIKKYNNGRLTDFSNIPKELADQYSYICKIADKYLVVTDMGILTYSQGKAWNLMYFKGSTENAKVASSVQGNSSNLYTALSDGRIFEYKNEKLEFLGVITDQPVAMNFSALLWVAGKEGLFFLENNGFVQTPLRTEDKIVGAFPTKNNTSILVFTGSGVKILSDR